MYESIQRGHRCRALERTDGEKKKRLVRWDNKLSRVYNCCLLHLYCDSRQTNTFLLFRKGLGWKKVPKDLNVAFFMSKYLTSEIKIFTLVTVQMFKCFLLKWMQSEMLLFMISNAKSLLGKICLFVIDWRPSCFTKCAHGFRECRCLCTVRLII